MLTDKACFATHRALLAASCILLALLIAGSSPPDPTSDEYPGTAAYTRKVHNLVQKVKEDSMDFPWHRKRGVSKRELCRQLVGRHYRGLNRGMTATNADWLMCEDVTRESLEAACIDALTNPSGFWSAAGFDAWRGHHLGRWYEVNQSFWDEAEWSAPVREPTRLGSDDGNGEEPRICDAQKVEWPGRKVGRFGWHQSHPDINYLWGWDPKDAGNEHGDIGTHIGFPFDMGPCSFIIWITPKAAFLEGINTETMVTKTLDGRQVTGYPKTSTALTGGRGQWLVER